MSPLTYSRNIKIVLIQSVLALSRNFTQKLFYQFNCESRKLRILALALSVTMTFVFFFPSLEQGGKNAGYLYGGDVIGWYLPALMKTHQLLNSFNFSAIDYSAFNGSSDFFISPNFFPYHPMVVAFSVIIPPEIVNVRHYGALLVSIYFFHSLLCLFFSIRVSNIIFGLSFGLSAFVGVTFAFSIHMISALGQPPFFMVSTLLPWTIWACWCFKSKRTISCLLLATLPVVTTVLSGYIPLGLSCLLLAALLLFFQCLSMDKGQLIIKDTWENLLYSSMPFLLGALILTPYLWSIYSFHQETSSSSVPSLFYSAHQLAQLPQSILKLLSKNFITPGPTIEFSLSFGFIPIALGIIFLFSVDRNDQNSHRNLNWIAVFGVIYFATVLATFGDFSVVSDFVYHFIPQIGKMHIYQRFLLPAHFVFSLLVAFMISQLLIKTNLFAARVVWVLFLILTFTISYLVAFNSPIAQTFKLNNFIVFELFLALLFLTVFLFASKRWIVFAVIVLSLLPSFDRIYDYSIRGHKLSSHMPRQPAALDLQYQTEIVNYFKSSFDKDIVKYADITPMWGSKGIESFPKVFPYFVLNEVQLSSYGGFTFYLSALGKYLERMPIGANVTLQPDWQILSSTGADFLVADGSAESLEKLAFLLEPNFRQKMFRLRNGNVILPMRKSTETEKSTHFDNGFVRLGKEKQKIVTKNLALGQSVKLSSIISANEKVLVDDNLGGDFNKGEVVHTALDKDAWLEIDLAGSKDIGEIHIWNRTDCCSNRSSQFWVFLSEKPFPANKTAQEIKDDPDIWSVFVPNMGKRYNVVAQGKRARFVRVQFDGKSNDPSESYLSFAEIQVFESSKVEALETLNTDAELQVSSFEQTLGKGITLNFTNTKSVSLEYLFWNNPRLSYYLDGKLLDVKKNVEYLSLNIKPGTHIFKVVYQNLGLQLFGWVYLLYFTILLGFLPFLYWRKKRTI